MYLLISILSARSTYDLLGIYQINHQIKRQTYAVDPPGDKCFVGVGVDADLMGLEGL